MAKKLYDAVATVGKYTDKNGDEKKRYVTVGAVFESDRGGLSLKLETIPVGPEWNGWIAFFEPKYPESSPSQQQHSKAKANGYQRQDEEIPF